MKLNDKEIVHFVKFSFENKIWEFELYEDSGMIVYDVATEEELILLIDKYPKFGKEYNRIHNDNFEEGIDDFDIKDIYICFWRDKIVAIEKWLLKPID